MRSSIRTKLLLGDPVGDERAFTHVGDRRVRLFDLGGGSSSAAAPTSQTITNVSIPDYAKPYMETLLGQASAVSDVNANPYQIYGGDRFAQFTPLQQQSYANAQGLGVTPQLDMASDIAANAAQQATGLNYSPSNLQSYQMSSAPQVGSQNFNSAAAQQYMNPYTQNVIDIQQREAQRQADIATTQRNAQAVGAGAFGGSRQAIMDAEAARNLATQKGDIQAQGLQTAYNNAQQQFNADQGRNMSAQTANQNAALNVGQQNLNALLNTQQLAEQSRQYGAGLGLQGLQTALQGASQLGSLGGQQYSQQTGNIALQNQLGTQQQNQVQNILSQNYQDFINQQNMPFKQLGFMSDLLRGTPSSSSSSIYSAAPSTTSQLAGIAGLAGMATKKRGGQIKGKAGLAELAYSKI